MISDEAWVKIRQTVEDAGGRIQSEFKLRQLLEQALNYAKDMNRGGPQPFDDELTAMASASRELLDRIGKLDARDDAQGKYCLWFVLGFEDLKEDPLPPTLANQARLKDLVTMLQSIEARSTQWRQRRTRGRPKRSGPEYLAEEVARTLREKCGLALWERPNRRRSSHLVKILAELIVILDGPSGRPQLKAQRLLNKVVKAEAA